MKLLSKMHVPFLDIPQNFFSVIFHLLICRTSKNLLRFNLQQLSHQSQAAEGQLIITSMFYTLLNTNSISLLPHFINM